MLKLLEDLTCQLFHGRWAYVVSYSAQGAYRCTKAGCGAQARHDRPLAGPAREPGQDQGLELGAMNGTLVGVGAGRRTSGGGAGAITGRVTTGARWGVGVGG